MAVQLIEALEGMVVGKGFDTAGADVKISTAVTGKVGPVPGAGGQQGNSSFVIVRNSAESSNRV